MTLRKKSIKIIVLLLKIATVILFTVLLLKANWKTCIPVFGKLSLFHLSFCLLLFYTGYFIKILRWKNILKGYDIHENYFILFKVFLIGGYLGIISPGKIGDFGRLYYLNDKNDSNAILSSLIIDRINDLIVLVLLGGIGFYYLLTLHKIPLQINLATIVIVISLITVFTFVIYLLFKKKILHFLSVFRSGISLYNTIFQLTATILAMLVLYGTFIVVANGIGFDIPFLDMFFIGVFSGIINLLPISIHGIGVREISLIYLLGLYQVVSDIALAYSLIIFALQIMTLLPGMYWFYRNPIKAN